MGRRWFTVMGATLALSSAACGSSVEMTTGIDDPAAGCVAGAGETVAAGAYTQPGTGSATNVLVLLSNGRWCADAMSPGATALSSEGTWSATVGDGGTGFVVTKTNSLYFNVVSCDGQTVKSYRKSDGVYAGFSYVRQSPAAYSCDGQ